IIFCQDVDIIAQLIYLLHNRDVELHKKVCKVFASMFKSFTTEPVFSMEDFVGNGVRTIVESASDSGADAA
ncbi:hypothetical protein PENTCL1PPCAC_7860, partial [Pristionchus entomophagus]